MRAILCGVLVLVAAGGARAQQGPPNPNPAARTNFLYAVGQLDAEIGQCNHYLDNCVYPYIDARNPLPVGYWDARLDVSYASLDFTTVYTSRVLSALNLPYSMTPADFAAALAGYKADIEYEFGVYQIRFETMQCIYLAVVNNP